jgi:hypothetical protein
MAGTDYLSLREVAELDAAMHRQGHAETGTNSEHREDPECPHWGRNRPLPAGLLLAIPE